MLTAADLGQFTAMQKHAGLIPVSTIGSGLGALLRHVGASNPNIPLLMGLGGAGVGAAWGALAPFKNDKYVVGKDGNLEIVLDKKTKEPVVETMGRLPSSLITAGLFGLAGAGGALLGDPSQYPRNSKD